MAVSMTYFLYSYKERSYPVPLLFFKFVWNVTVWAVIFGIPYFLVYLIGGYVKRRFLK
ncbi:MAG: hypothetical protein K0Q79_1999 [Flavipsychrobacter sp.]|jgi:hypothetical protein|nr:hypothetical protein [Flavipsychrobacter sp.]